MPVMNAIVSDTPTHDNPIPARKFSIFITEGTNNVLLMEQKPNRRMPKMIGWVMSEDWGNKFALALEGYDGDKPALHKPAWVKDREIYLSDGYLLAMFQFQTQAKRVANAYNHFVVGMLAVLS